MDRYCLPDDYEANAVNLTREESGQVYWDERRIGLSGFWQWDVYAWAAAIVEAEAIATVIDVGCGTGRKLAKLLQPRVQTCIGVDQERPIAYCRETHSGCTWIVDDLEAPSFSAPPGRSLIICCDVIEHLTEPDHLMRYLARLCGPDSLLLLASPERTRLRGPNNRQPSNPSHIREWTAAELGCYLSRFSFEIERTRFLRPLKPGWNRATLFQFLKQARPGRRWRFNQAVLCRRRELGDPIWHGACPARPTPDGNGSCRS